MLNSRIFFASNDYLRRGWLVLLIQKAVRIELSGVLLYIINALSITFSVLIVYSVITIGWYFLVDDYSIAKDSSLLSDFDSLIPLLALCFCTFLLILILASIFSRLSSVLESLGHIRHTPSDSKDVTANDKHKTSNIFLDTIFGILIIVVLLWSISILFSNSNLRLKLPFQPPKSAEEVGFNDLVSTFNPSSAFSVK